jgi:hypothetical protein
MKTIENVTLYKCDFCKKELKRKHAMVKHEELCLNNPINSKACMNGCEFLKQEEKEVWFDNQYYHPDHCDNDGKLIKVNVFRCTKFDKLMYPYSIERRSIVNDYPSTFEDQEPMPKECDAFEDGFSGISDIFK